MAKKSSMSLPVQMLAGLVLGVVIGAFVSSDLATTWFKPLGDLFIRLIRMVVVPLVFATLVAGAAGIADVSKLGRVAVKTIITFGVTTAIAVMFGLIFAGIIDPGIGLSLSTEGLKAANVQAPSMINVLLDIVPINPMEAFAKGSILQIIFFAVMFGFCLSALGERGRPLLEFFEIMGDVMIRMTKGIFEPWLIAFTTCSSAAAMPANLLASRRLGSTKTIASFAVPLGNTINMNGTAIYMGVTAIFGAQVYGIDLSMADQITIVLMGVLAAIGTAGVPGAGLIMSTIVFTQVGIPLEAVALIAGIDRILDMIRTSINVVGDSTTALVVSKLEGELGTEPVDEDEGLVA